MAISAFSLAASSGRLPLANWAAESLRCLIIEPITPTTSASSSGLAFSISRYFIWLFSMRSVPSRRASLARAASFMSASIRSASMSCSIKGPARATRRGGGHHATGRETPSNGVPQGVGFRAKGLHHALPRLLEGALLRRQRLLLALDRRLLVVLALPDLAQDASLFTLLLEALHGVLERLAFLDAHARHSPNHRLPVAGDPPRKRGSISACRCLSNPHARRTPRIYSRRSPEYCPSGDQREMSEARLSVALPEYETELASN